MFNKLEELFPTWIKRLRQLGAIVEADVRKLKHDPVELFTRMIQPALWLLIFGQAMNHARMISIPESSYLDFIAPGILAQSVLFVAIFYGISLIWERDAGILHKILVTPTPRSLLVLGRAIAAGIRSLSQVLIIYILSFLLGIHLKLDPLSILGVLFMVLLGGALFSTLSLIVATIVKKRERFMGIGQVLTMPLFFASNALYPISQMPGWLKNISAINPLTYMVDGLRYFMITTEKSHYGLLLDFGVPILFFLVLWRIATPLYPKIVY